MTAFRPIVNTASRLVPEGSNPLSPADLEALSALGPAEAPGITKLRIRHHAMARMLAMGAHQCEVEEMFGGQVSVLIKSPAFRELVDRYIADFGDLKDLRKRTVGVATEGVMLMHQKLLEAADDPKMTLGKITEATFGLLDRAGVGPNKTSHHTFGPSAEVLDAIKAAAEGGEIIDVQATEVLVVGADRAEGAVGEASSEGSDEGSSGGIEVPGPRR